MRRGVNMGNRKAMGIATKITTRDSEAFKAYLREVSSIKQFPSVSAEHECAMRAYKDPQDTTVDSPLVKAIRVKAREELVKRNLRFVISVAKQYIIDGISLEDLVNEGNIGLITASERFNPTSGLKFISYSVWWIRKGILAYLSNNSRTIRLPNHKIDAIKKYKIRMGVMEQKLQRIPSIEEYLEEYLDTNETEMETIEALIGSDIRSLDKTLNDDDGNTMCDILEDVSAEQADELVNIDDIKNNFDFMLNQLTPLQKFVIIKMNGLSGEPKHTLDDVGDLLYMSRENVRQIEEKTYKMLQQKFKHTPYNYFDVV